MGNTGSNMTEALSGINTKYFDFVYHFHKTMVEQNITLVYEGVVTQTITKAFSSLTEERIEKAEENLSTRKRVYHVMVECLQNICKHADDIVTGEPDIPGTGIFLVGQNEKEYVITTGNVIATERQSETTELLDHINTLDTDEIKKLYKEKMRDGHLSEKSGAGLGFIDIVKKTGNQIEYRIERINDKTSFIILVTKISR